MTELLVVYREPQDRLALYMSACDVLVFPSHQEGSPNIVKQAMACNLPIVATDVGDVRQVISRTSGCFVCAPEVNDFRDRIRLLLNRRERTSGRQDIGHLDCASVAAKVIDVYERTLRWPTRSQAENARALS
jgi:glycosyltransferase involved in cell wall biosynthesis